MFCCRMDQPTSSVDKKGYRFEQNRACILCVSFMGLSAQLAPHDASVPFDLISWNYAAYDIVTDAHDPNGLGLTLNPDDLNPFELEERQSVDAIGAVTRVLTDGAGRTLVSVDAESNASVIQMDAGSNLLQSRDPNQIGFDAVYDELGRMTSRTDTYGNTTSQTYDQGSNVVAATDAKSQVSSTVYDAGGRRKNVIDRLNGVTAYAYDLGSNLLSITDAQLAVTSYEYNVRNEKVKEIYPDHSAGSVPGDSDYGIKEFSFDPVGRLEMAFDQLADSMTMKYDLVGRLTQRDYRTNANSPSGTIADSDSFTYDKAARMLTATSGRYSNVVTMAYDDGGRLDSETITNSGRAYTTSREYDDRGVVNKLIYHDGSTVDRVIDERGLLEELKLDGTNIASWQFDNAGRRTQQTYSNGVVTDYSYRDDANGKDNLLASIDTTHPGGGSSRHVGDYTYTWDENGNKTSETISGSLSGYGFNSSASPAAYDAADRLTGWNRTDGNRDQSWSLSLVGDWNGFETDGVPETRSHSGAHELTQITGGANAGVLAYDAKGNLIENSNGDKYVYDFNNRISQIDIDGDGTVDRQNRYDALGRRVMFHNGSQWYDCVVSGQQLLMVYRTNQAPQYKFIFGSYVDEPVMIVRRLFDNSLKYFYHRNQQYSVVALTRMSDGQVVERCAYDAYGNTTILNGNGANVKANSTYNNPFMYTGRFSQNGTGLYYFRARWYSPALGRFISRDPLGYVDGMSLYRGYFAPKGLDPTGNEDLDRIIRDKINSILGFNRFDMSQGGVQLLRQYSAAGTEFWIGGQCEFEKDSTKVTWSGDGPFRPSGATGAVLSELTFRFYDPPEPCTIFGQQGERFGETQLAGPFGSANRVIYGTYINEEKTSRIIAACELGVFFTPAVTTRFAGCTSGIRTARTMTRTEWEDFYRLQRINNQGLSVPEKADQVLKDYIARMPVSERPKVIAATAAYNRQNGQIAIGRNGNVPFRVAKPLALSAENVGGVGSTFSLLQINGRIYTLTVGRCAEFHAVNSLLSRTPGAGLHNIGFTVTIRPRTLEVVPPCIHCEQMFWLPLLIGR